MPLSIKALRITQKLTVVNVILALTLVAVGGSLLYWQNQRLMQHSLHKRVAQHGAMVAENLVHPVELWDWKRAAAIMDSFNEDPAIALAELRGVSDEVIVTYLHPGSPEAGGDRSRLHRETLPILDRYGMEIGSLVIYASRDEVEDASRDLLVTLVGILVLAMVLSLIIGHSTQRMVTAPLQNLTQLIRKVRATEDYSLRLAPLYPDDLGRLTEDVNAMLEIIERRDRNLSREVEDRTRRLEAKNARLQEEMRERERTEKLARAHQEKFENAFVNAPIGMALVLADGRLIQRNEMFDRLLESRGQGSLDLLTLIQGEAREDVREELQQLVIGSQQTFTLDVECRSYGGRELTCAMHFSAIREDGEFLYAVLQVQDTTEERRLAAELAHQARHDALTGLPNRRAFEQSLGDLARPSAIVAYPLTIGLIDLDKFKAVNDLGGHAAGDALLQQVAETIRACVRERDMVVRLGGDEFAVILKRCDAATGMSIAEVIRARIEELDFTWDGTAYELGASIGVVCLDRPPPSLDAALRRADAACYAAKNGGRNRVCIVGEEQTVAGTPDGDVRWAQLLQQAIARDGLSLFAQEVRDLRNRETVRRVEVLLRMHDDDGRASVLPGAFLPLAERYGLASRLDRWVLDHLLHRLTALAPAQQPAQEFWLNLSGASLEDGDFVSYLTDRLGHGTLPRGTLNFELPESALARHLQVARRLMEKLRPHGCRFAIDDFGAGSSSLAHLKKLPVDLIKIDGALVRDITDDRIDRIFVQSVIDIAREMRITTCVKHVETEPVLEAVRALGATQGQGFALHRPAPLFAQTGDDVRGTGQAPRAAGAPS